MNKKLKQIIKLAFNTPDATRKYEFLESLPFPKARYSDFIFNQISYVRKRVWVMSSMLFIIVLCGLSLVPSEDVMNITWLVSSLFPFVALVAVTEMSRSASYNMAELEMSCKYSLSDIVLVRLGAVGGFNVIIFITILLMLVDKTNYGILQLGVYIFTPFMLSCTVSLAVVNYLKTRETIYVCGGVSCFVSILNAFFISSKEHVFADKFLQLWYGVFFLLLIGALFQTVKLIKKTEELAWNLQLTD